MAADTRAGRPFVGRREVVESLRRRIENVRAGAGEVTLLLGEAGVGKSALIDLVVEEARGRDVLVLVGRAPPLDDPPPFSLLRSSIESVRPSPDSDGTTPSFPTDPVLIGFAPRLGEEALPDLVTMEQRLLDALGGGAPRGGPERDRVLFRLAEQFREITGRGRPLVLVLEDVHRADEPSVAAVEFLAEQLRHEPFWLLATSRPRRSLSDASRGRLDRFGQATHAKEVVLRALTSGEVADYLQATDPSRSFSPDEVARRFTESGGVPLLLQQLDHRPIGAGVAAGLGTEKLPPLDPEAERALDAAAVLGPEISFDTLLRVAGEQDEERFAEVIDQLVGLGLLVERSGEVLAFPADRLREQVYTGLPPHLREVLHWSAGETLEATGRGGVANVYALARHFYLGRALAKSVRYNRLAAEIADRALVPEVAREHLLRAVESQRDVKPPNVEVESDLVLELARMTEELGRLPEAETTLREFLDREKDDPLLSPRRRGSLEIFLSRVLTDRGNIPSAAELAQKVLDAPTLETQLVLRVGAHHQLGMACYYQGEYANALRHHTEELRLARELGNPLVTLRAQIWRLAALSMMGPTDEAVAEAREITVARDRLGSTRESAQAHLFLGDLLADARCTLAQRKEALDEYARAVEFAERAHDPRRVGWARYKTGELLCEARRFGEANEALQSAVDIFREIGDSVGLSMATKVRGQIALAEGAYDRAEEYLLDAYRLLKGLHHTLEEIDVVLRLGQLDCARGDRGNASRHVTELERLRLPVVRPDLAEELLRLKGAIAAPGGERAVP